MFGSVHPRMALEFMHWLQKTDFQGHIYFDTFPRNEDPVREAEYNIRRCKALWAKAKALDAAGIDACLEKHDAMGTLELLERLESPAPAAADRTEREETRTEPPSRTNQPSAVH